MKVSRRSFVATGVAGLAGALVGRTARCVATEMALPDEDGYKLWLRYAPPGSNAEVYRRLATQIFVTGQSATAKAIREELSAGLAGILGAAIPASESIEDGAIIVGTPKTSDAINRLNWTADLDEVGPEGFLIRSTTIANHPVIGIASNGELGALYGAFHFLRMLQTALPIERLDISKRPKIQIRMLNHWDNLNGSVERGYAGRSLWLWGELPNTLSPRYADYARANAAIGINAAAINNVNADFRILTAEYLRKVAALADVWRPYGIRMYLSANFAAPKRLGGLPTADPLDKAVAAWWQAKADEIYELIPDFGGFLVKANSEGQPGPKDYGRNHAEGSAVLADALAPHGGNVIWRAFVYDEDIDPDRTKRAYIEFTKLDGQFRPNVVLQIKNGPLDFQPREPFHPLFGALKETSAFAEVQPTQEYLGQAKHLVYLGTMWKEFLDSDTFAHGPGSTVGKVIAGELQPTRLTGMAGVVNPGLDANWCGHHFCQANWYAFGRLAWDPQLSAQQIAEEWVRMTFTNNADNVKTICGMMMSSRETFVNYTMPLGLHHLIGGDHYAPHPQNTQAARPDWTGVYYHQASADGIGFDRTSTGDKAVEQYFPPVCEMFDNLATCPEKLLLWFHRCGWDYKLKSGRTLWEELCAHYYQGAAQAAALQATWSTLAAEIDSARYKHVAARLTIQVADAGKWRDEILQYFQGFSGRPIVHS
ncbi:MAG TPA: alpha-glucuronidase family glycosyl hydrolase [Pirellulales bacterium]|jgi:alpha-glucuronidase|nr:alpha-glucuronidase family glycosyl hydrolase [Pirellulales bacterium]